MDLDFIGMEPNEETDCLGPGIQSNNVTRSSYFSPPIDSFLRKLLKRRLDPAPK